jgi:AcrR family transcriptional regulator
VARKPTDNAHVKGQLTLLEEELAAPIELPAPAESAAQIATISGPNTRVRAGNAMQRARMAAIGGALEVLAAHGVKNLTMADVADAGGLARATLYNHVRDKESLLLLVIANEARELAKVFASASTMPAALTATARAIAAHPALVGVREHDPLSLAAIAVPATGEGWTAIRELTRQALAARGSKATDAQVDLLLRWLTSFITVPSDDASRNSQATELAKSLK